MFASGWQVKPLQQAFGCPVQSEPFAPQQTPLLHVPPRQQSPCVRQSPPTAEQVPALHWPEDDPWMKPPKQVGAVQTPFLQKLQHCEKALQTDPEPKQPFGPSEKFVPPQQSPSLLHWLPSCLQPQTPFWQPWPLVQQTLPQTWPLGQQVWSGMQVCPLGQPQTPFEQQPPGHCAACTHVPPAPPEQQRPLGQLFTQPPLLQQPPQVLALQVAWHVPLAQC